MQRHLEELATKHEILLDTRWIKRTADAYATRETDGNADEVHTPPIRSDITYVTALHEFGHILGSYQDSRRSLVRECWAWLWARENALVWTHRMEREAVKALKLCGAKDSLLRRVIPSPLAPVGCPPRRRGE